MHRRPNEGLLAGLYEFPNVLGELGRDEAVGLAESMGLAVRDVKRLADAKHVFTHLTWHLHGYELEIVPPDHLDAGYDAPTREELERDYSIPGAFRAYRP